MLNLSERSFVRAILLSLSLSTFFAFFFSYSVAAQYAAPDAPVVQTNAVEILQALLPAEAQDRGIKRQNPSVVLPTGGAKATILVDFEEGTDLLSVSGMKTLRELSTAMQDQRLVGSVFQIAVHGYSAGDPQLQVRTARRAQMISDHLASFYQINIQSLQPVGVGAQYVVNVNNPNDPMNFRVEIFNISQS